MNLIGLNQHFSAHPLGVFDPVSFWLALVDWPLSCWCRGPVCAIQMVNEFFRVVLDFRDGYLGPVSDCFNAYLCSHFMFLLMPI